MNWYKTARLVPPYHGYRNQDEIDMHDLCRPDNESIKNIQNLINKDNSLPEVHEMGITKAFNEEIEPRLLKMETVTFKREIKPFLLSDAFSEKFEGNYWKKQWIKSFSKFLWPKLTRCKEDYLRAFLKGDWDALAKMIYDDTERYINAKKSNAKRRPGKEMDINPNQIFTYNPIVAPAMERIGVGRVMFAKYIYEDRPEGVQQLYKEQKWQEVVDTITAYIEPAKTKKINRQQLEEIYNETVGQDAFAKQHITFNKFFKLIYGKHSFDRIQRSQMILQHLLQTGEHDKIMFIINDYLRSIPRIAFPMIYKQYVQPVVPEWTYESFFHIVKNNPSIKAAIANEDTATIEQFVEAYRQKFQQGDFYRNQQRKPRLIQPRQPQEAMPYNATQNPAEVPFNAAGSYN